MDAVKLCTFAGCDRLSHARKLCSGHYQQLRANADMVPLPRIGDPSAEMTAHVRRCGFAACLLAEVTGKACGKCGAR